MSVLLRSTFEACRWHAERDVTAITEGDLQ